MRNIETMNHHLEIDQFKNMHLIHEQVNYVLNKSIDKLFHSYFIKITFGFGPTYEKFYDSECNCNRTKMILPKIANLYDSNEDPFRMKSLHCLLFPEDNNCKNLLVNALVDLKSSNREIHQLKDQLTKLNQIIVNKTL